MDRQAPVDTDRIVLTIDELKQLNKANTLEVLSAFGLDITRPQELQRDFQFVRTWRTTSESIRGKALCTAVGIVITGALAALWLGIKSIIQ
jgi:hypothetical protein